MKKTISILTESTILGKIPIIFGQIDKAYKVHVKGLTFCSLPLTKHGICFFFFFWRNYHIWTLITLFMFHLFISVLLHHHVLQKDQLLRQLNDYFLKKLKQVHSVVHGKQNVTTPTNSPFHHSQITMNKQLLIGLCWETTKKP